MTLSISVSSVRVTFSAIYRPSVYSENINPIYLQMCGSSIVGSRNLYFVGNFVACSTSFFFFCGLYFQLSKYLLYFHTCSPDTHKFKGYSGKNII